MIGNWEMGVSGGAACGGVGQWHSDSEQAYL